VRTGYRPPDTQTVAHQVRRQSGGWVRVDRDSVERARLRELAGC